MGKNKKTRKKYSDHHSFNSTLFSLSKPLLLSMIHSAEGRRKLWEMTEQELQNNPSSSEIVHSLRQNLVKYDQLQGKVQESPPIVP